MGKNNKKKKGRGKSGQANNGNAQQKPTEKPIENAQMINDLIRQLGLSSPVPEAYQLDPTAAAAYAGSEITLGDQHPGTAYGLTFSTLRQMARVDIAAAIIGTRLSQLVPFTEPQSDEGQLGFKIGLRDPDASPTRQDKKRAFQITDFVQSCGDNRAVGFELDFEAFTRMVMRDSLTLDQACFEILRTRRGQVAGFVPVDAATIRRAVPSAEERKAGRYVASPEVAFVQVIQQQRVAAWAPHELGFGIRRPRSNIYVNRYGFPELEEVMKAITALIHAESYNAQNFTHGLHASGLLAVKSRMDVDAFENLRKQFYALLSGAFRTRKTPIIQLNPQDNEEIQSINLANTNKEMEFQEWIAFLMKIACAIFQMDPAEINFVHGAEGQTGALTQSGPEMRVQYSKERGLRPLLRAYAKWLNHWIIQAIDPRFELRFVGLEEQLKNSRLERDIKLLGGYMTYNEIRKRNDLPPLDNPAADMIGTATYVNAAMQAAAMAQEQEQAEQGAPEQGAEPTPEEGGKAAEPTGTPDEAPQDEQGADEGAQGEQGGAEQAPEGGAKNDPFAEFFKSLPPDARAAFDKLASQLEGDDAPEGDDCGCSPSLSKAAGALRGGELRLVDELSAMMRDRYIQTVKRIAPTVERQAVEQMEGDGEA